MMVPTVSTTTAIPGRTTDDKEIFEELLVVWVLPEGDAAEDEDNETALLKKPVQNLYGAHLFYVLSPFTRCMAKSSYEIGEKEKHILNVDHDFVMKRTRIELDGEKLADEYHYSPLAKKWSFDIGSSELHKVEVSLGGFSYFKRREMKVLVDGKPVQSSST